jgi:hemolysin activation/secretion protein
VPTLWCAWGNSGKFGFHRAYDLGRPALDFVSVLTITTFPKWLARAFNSSPVPGGPDTFVTGSAELTKRPPCGIKNTGRICIALLWAGMATHRTLAATDDTCRTHVEIAQGVGDNNVQLEPNGNSCDGIVIKETKFEGVTVFGEEDLRGLDPRLNPRPESSICISGAEFQDLTELITRRYVDKGYINSRALDVSCKNQVATFRVKEGKAVIVFDKSVIKDSDKYGNKVQESYVKQRLSHQPFNVKYLEAQFRLLLGEPLIETVQATVEPKPHDDQKVEPNSEDEELAYVRVKKLTLSEPKIGSMPYSLSTYANNYQPAAIGAEILGLQANLMNITSMGDSLDAHIQGRSHRNRSYGISWTMPIIDTTRFFTRYNSGASSVIEEPLKTLDVESELTSWEAGVEQQLFSNALRHRQFWLGLGFVHRKNATFLLGEPFSFVAGEPTGVSKTDTWQFSQDYVQQLRENHIIHLRSTLNWGQSNVDPTLSGASDKDYFLWQGQVQSLHRLGESYEIRFKGNAQSTTNRLVPLERVSIGGAHTVRGYRENQVVRDKGYSVSVELAYKLQRSERQSWSLIPFVDYGAGWNEGEKRENLASVGLGVDWRLNFNKKRNGVTARLDFAKRLVTPETTTSGDLQDHGIHFELRFETLRPSKQ